MLRSVFTISLVALCAALSARPAKVCEGAFQNTPSGFIAWKYADGHLGVNREKAKLLLETRAESLIDCVAQCNAKSGCVYASWEEYGSCAGYDTIMGEVVKSSSSAFHGAAKKGTCDDEESRAISGEIDVDPEVAVVADKIADFIAAAQVECCEIRF